MVDQDNKSQQPVISALLASGFPFQTAVAKIARQAGCQVIEEFPWRGDGGDDRFLDLVATKGNFVVTIECKKTQKEILTFLQPRGIDGNMNRIRCLYLTKIHGAMEKMELYCSDWQLIPKSAEAMFCVVSTSTSGKDQRLLERDAQLLIRGTDAYARRFKADFRKFLDRYESNRPIIPVLVTNAELFLAEYEPSDVSLETGQLPTLSTAKLESVPWVRFRKAFGAGGKDIGDRTVFIVRANSLAKWFGKLEFAAMVPSEDGRILFE